MQNYYSLHVIDQLLLTSWYWFLLYGNMVIVAMLSYVVISKL